LFFAIGYCIIFFEKIYKLILQEVNMEPSGRRPARILNVFTLGMINVAAVCGIRNLPVMAEYGFSSFFFILLAAVSFFIPASLVSAELATGWPKAGGVFAWVKEAFGHRTGFLAIWLQWIENAIYYPALLSFIAATLAYIFNPDLANNKIYTLSVVLIVFWGTTFINLFGMRTSGWVSTLCVICGTLLPGMVIMGLGIEWFFSGKPLQISFDWAHFIPNLSSPDQLVFFTGIIVALLGMEMSAVHALNVKNPQKDYPKAIFLSAVIILAFYILGSLAIAIVIPQAQINLVAGSLQAFSYFVNAYGIGWLVPVMAALILIGAIGLLSTWTVGPPRGLLAAAQSGDLPPLFRRVNRHEMPVSLMIFQAFLVTSLSVLFLFMPSVNSAFWILTVLLAQLYLIMYILMFAAAIKLRYKKPDAPRPYKIPCGKAGIWIVAGIGILGSLFTIIMGFFPPAQIPTGNAAFYISFLVIGIVVLCFAPSIILLFQKPHWKHPLEHEKR
jgi:glutamate:GABA antiporter